MDANRISTAETDTELAEYCSNNTISGHLFTLFFLSIQYKSMGKNAGTVLYNFQLNIMLIICIIYTIILFLIYKLHMHEYSMKISTIFSGSYKDLVLNRL